MTTSARFPNEKQPDGRPDWLVFIHEANGIEPGFFGEPDSTGDWWAGGYVEEYPDARVLMRTDGSVSIASKTERGERVIAETAKLLNIHVTHSTTITKL